MRWPDLSWGFWTSSLCWILSGLGSHQSSKVRESLCSGSSEVGMLCGSWVRGGSGINIIVRLGETIKAGV